MKVSKSVIYFSILLIVFLVIVVVYVILRNRNPEYKCQQDIDCGKNICDCKAMNKKYIKSVKYTCLVVCYGTPKCVMGMCRLIK